MWSVWLDRRVDLGLCAQLFTILLIQKPPIQKSHFSSLSFVKAILFCLSLMGLLCSKCKTKICRFWLYYVAERTLLFTISKVRIELWRSVLDLFPQWWEFPLMDVCVCACVCLCVCVWCVRTGAFRDWTCSCVQHVNFSENRNILLSQVEEKLETFEQNSYSYSIKIESFCSLWLIDHHYSVSSDASVCSVVVSLRVGPLQWDMIKKCCEMVYGSRQVKTFCFQAQIDIYLIIALFVKHL